MPALGAPLDLAKYEARNLRAHILGAAPSSPVTGQMYYNSGDNTLYWWDGSAWVSARGGGAAVGDATTGAKGVIQLAGDLAGTATSPQIAAGVITDAEVAAANKDGAVGVASLRTLGSGAAQAMPGNRTLDAITAPAAAVNLNSKLITNLLDPSNPQDAATKAYVDALVQGLDPKASVLVAYSTNITLTGAATNEGGTTPGNGARVLVYGQSSQPANGIYIVNTGGAWSRASDADNWNELISAFVFVEQGSNADNGFVCTVDAGGTLGTTAVTWTQFSGAGQIVSGAGLTKTGNTLDVGAGSGITVNADNVQISNNGVTNAMLADGAVNLATADVTGTLPIGSGGTGQTTQKTARETGLSAAGYYSSATHGAGTTITITQAIHGLRASRGLIVQVQDEATGNVEIPDVTVAANGDVTVTYGASVSANSKRVTVIG